MVLSVLLASGWKEILKISENKFLESSEEYSFEYEKKIWYSAPAHFKQVVRNHLDRKFPEKWIGRDGLHNLPARSPIYRRGTFLRGYI